MVLLNGSHDRETSAAPTHGGLMAASDVVSAICSALNREHGRVSARLSAPPSSYVTALLAPRGGSIPVDRDALAQLGVRYPLVLSLSERQRHVGALLVQRV